MATKIVDVSRWNGDVDYTALKKAGIVGVIIQAGYGMVDTQKDPYFEQNYKNAKKAGLKVGAYLYSYAMSTAEAKAEAKVMYGWIKGKTFDLSVYIDMEESSQANLGRTLCTKIAEIFCNNLRSRGYMVGVYANANWFRNYLDYNKLKSKYSIWLAQYASNKDFDCDIWQYTDAFVCNGKTFDCNYLYKSFAKSVYITAKRNSGLYNHDYKDPLDKSSKIIKTIPKGAKVKLLNDDGYGMAKVSYNGVTGYVFNSNFKGAKLSIYKKIDVAKGEKVLQLDLKNQSKVRKTIKLTRPLKFNLASIIGSGKYKGWYVLTRGRWTYYFNTK